METITLSKSEKKLLKRELGFPWILLFLFLIVVSLGVVFYYLAVVWGEAKVLSIFSDYETQCPEIDKYIKKLFIKISFISLKPALYFFSISVGMCLGQFIGHYQRAKLLKKLKIDTYL